MMNLDILQTLQKTQGLQGREGLKTKNLINSITVNIDDGISTENFIRGNQGRQGLIDYIAPEAPDTIQQENENIINRGDYKGNNINELHVVAPKAPHAPVEKQIIEQQEHITLQELLTKIGLHYGATAEEIEEETGSVLQNYSLEACLRTYRSVAQSLSISIDH